MSVLAACQGGKIDDAGAAGAAAVENRTEASGAGAGGKPVGAGSPAVAAAAGTRAAGAGGSAGSSKPAQAGGGGAAAGSGGVAAGSGGSAGTVAGTGGNAGTASAAGSGGVAISGPSRCEGADFLLCESFEADSLDSAKWSTLQSRPAIDDVRAARGEKSLHVHTGATGASGIETKSIFPRAEGHYHGRMFVYFDALPTAPQWAHWTIVGANGESGAGEIRLGGQHDGKIERFGVGTDHGPSGDWTNLDDDPKGAAKAVPLKEWLCVEWLHDWQNDETKFYLNGEEHASLATTADVKHGGSSGVPFELPEVGRVWVGFWNYDQGKSVMPGEFDVWIDEVALDVERIGCEK